LRVVGIGAAAGGLEALQQLLRHLPAAHDLTYVLAHHLSPTNESVLVGLLARMTALAVEEITDGLEPQPATLYVTPPTTDVIFQAGALRLVAPDVALGSRPSINRLLRSIASDRAHQGIGVVLSGTGSDGAYGLQAIVAAGGLALVQDPASTRYDGMPRAALLAGKVHAILPAAEIGPALLRLPGSRPELTQHAEPEPQETDATLAVVARLVREQTGFPLGDYKSGTVRRRVARRMSELELISLDEYVRHLQAQPGEGELLVNESLISVTSFFRDPEAFAALGAALSAREPQDVLRCWVPACATGEEAYTVALLLENAPPGGDPPIPYLIFASDMDEESLQIARAAHYRLEALDAIPPAQQRTGIERLPDRFRVASAIRGRMVFTRHNVIEDPPFTRLDLVSCRNLLIYLNPDAQRQVLETFHYALRPGGLLFLGTSESAEVPKDGWEPIDAQARLYRRRDATVTYSARKLHIQSARASRDASAFAAEAAAPVDPLEIRVLESLASRFAPPSVVIDADDQVVQFHGDLSPFLRFPSGRARLSLFDLVDDRRRAELRAFVLRCRSAGAPLEGSRLWLEERDGRHAVRLSAAPLRAGEEELLIVSFRLEEAVPAPHAGGAEPPDPRHAAVLRELEQDLDQARADLALLVRELELARAKLQSASERQQSANEELVSANEELQASNEELRSTNEELQSTNEELLTLNEELRLKTAEAAANATDLANIKESISFPLVVVDNALRVTQANTASKTLFASAAPLVGELLTSLARRVDLPDLAEQIHEVLGTGEVRSVDIRGHRPPYFVLHIMPYRDQLRAIAGAVLVFDDVTELRRAQDFAQAVANNVPGLIGYWDAQERCRFISRRSDEWFGITNEAMRGRPMREVLGERLYTLEEPCIAGALRGERQGFDREWTKANGETGHAWVEYEPELVDGKARGFYMMVTDVTQLKHTQLTLAALNEDLRRERDRAETASRMKSAFLANMSHEIRTPLNAIIGFTQLLQRDTLPPPQTEWLAKIGTSATHLLAIINDLLDLSKIEAGQMLLSETTFRLEDLLAQLADLSDGALREKGLDMRFDMAGIPQSLRGDELRLRQVLLNYVSNAIKFSEQGTIEVRGRVLARDGEAIKIRFDVEDNGIGVHEELQSHLFQPFAQLERASTRHRGGTGLGLAITKRLAQAMGGNVGFISRKGAGSTFWMTAWLHTAPPPPPPAASKCVETQPSFAGRHVLMAEDNRMNLHVLGEMLQALGVQYTIARNGIDAVTQAQTGAFDLILMDVLMPEMDGLEATRQIRRLTGNTTLPIIAVTASAFDEERDACLAAGMSDFLPKPISFKLLRSLLAQWLPAHAAPT
jgi:two-component system, chemotaxis family, CheB/CheR fusion protein